ncbi:MAG: sigma 54-dependent Fis family transcriptional regulator [Deltaproteobacteria bacterium]|nr:sigma 54-dependent Fis family transcriptional regulator [Deltaproteobacteria bacterium]
MQAPRAGHPPAPPPGGSDDEHPTFSDEADDRSLTATRTLAIESHRTLHIRRARLRVTAGASRGAELVTDRSPITLGTAREADLRLDDRAVSRRHAAIELVPKGWLLTDLESRNGTFLDGARIEKAYLRAGSEIRVGETTLRFDPREERIDVAADEHGELGPMIGRSVRMRELFGLVRRVAPMDVTVLVTGETGTGKELVARAIHDLSPRKDGPFVVVDCGSIPPTLIESELFGHEKGAFTGATAAYAGAFERADGGTVFLDELGELRLDLQPKLLRVLEQRTFRRVGGAHTKKVDIRVVAATHRDLEREVHAGRFRSDLFFRLSVIHIVIPPLRERRDDIPWIVRKVLADPRLAPRLGSEPKAMGDRTVTDAAMHRLLAYDWPGNVRELQNVVHQMVALSDGARVDVEHLPPRLAASVADGRATTVALGLADATSFKDARDGVLAAFEKEFLSSLLRRSKGNISEAARQCGLHRKTVERLVREHGIDVHAIVRQKGDDE